MNIKLKLKIKIIIKKSRLKIINLDQLVQIVLYLYMKLVDIS